MSLATAPVVTDHVSKAFRSVFCDPDEAFILALIDSKDVLGLSEFCGAVAALRRDGIPARVVVYGCSSSDMNGCHLEGILVLEEWARPAVRETVRLATVVVVLGQNSEDLMFDCSGAVQPVPIVLGQTPTKEFSTLESLLPWDRKDIGELQRFLRRFIHVEPRARLQLGGEKEVERRPTATQSVRAKTATTSGRYILQNDWGIGDELLLSAVAREILRAHPHLEIWIRSRHGFRFPQYVRRDPPPPDAKNVETIYQNPVLYGPAAHSPYPGHLVQQMLFKFSIDTGLSVQAEDVRPELDLDDVRTTGRKSRTVIVHTRPNRRLSSKDWGLDRWRRLLRILKDSGISALQVGDKEEPLLDDAEDLRGVPASELPAVFLQASAVVCVVGFLMHLAEATRTPAVIIYGGREHPAIDGYPDQIHLASEPLVCRGRWGCHLAPDLACPHEMKCMERISPELVARQVFSVLGSVDGGRER